MPTVAIFGSFRVFFYSADRIEPVHGHVERESNVAKYWLDPVRLARSGGFASRDLSQIEKLLQEHQKKLIEAWHDYFGA